MVQFLQLEEGVEGLIHVSEMAWTRRNVAPSRIVNKGDEIEAIVLEISRQDKRISLGAQAAATESLGTLGATCSRG